MIARPWPVMSSEMIESESDASVHPRLSDGYHSGLCGSINSPLNTSRAAIQRPLLATLMLLVLPQAACIARKNTLRTTVIVTMKGSGERQGCAWHVYSSEHDLQRLEQEVMRDVHLMAYCMPLESFLEIEFHCCPLLGAWVSSSAGQHPRLSSSSSSPDNRPPSSLPTCPSLI